MWLKHEFVAIASLFLKVVNETRRLCYMIEGDALLVYKLQDTVKFQKISEMTMIYMNS